MNTNCHNNNRVNETYLPGKVRPIRQAVILAAGIGIRLQPKLNGKPKCLIDIDGFFLIEYQIMMLHFLGIREICVVVGYEADLVKSIVEPLGCTCIMNEIFAETNSLYSLWLTKDWVRDTFVLSNCDILAHPRIYRHLMESLGSVITYDSLSGMDDEHMKVTINQGRLTGISKKIPLQHVNGENVGILKFPKTLIPILFDRAAQILQTAGLLEWAPSAIGLLARDEPITGFDIAGIPWVEIDFPDDLKFAHQCVWPEIKKCLSPRVTHAKNQYPVVTQDRMWYTYQGV